MPEEYDSPWDAVLDALGSDEAIRFLSCLSWELTIAARAEYGPEGTMPPGSEFSLRSYNELLHRTSMQMCRAVGVLHGGYPDEDFIGMLQTEAARGDLVNSLEYAVGSALRTLGSGS